MLPNCPSFFQLVPIYPPPGKVRLGRLYFPLVLSFISSYNCPLWKHLIKIYLWSPLPTYIQEEKVLIWIFALLVFVSKSPCYFIRSYWWNLIYPPQPSPLTQASFLSREKAPPAKFHFGIANPGQLFYLCYRNYFFVIIIFRKLFHLVCIPEPKLFEHRKHLKY